MARKQRVVALRKSFSGNTYSPQGYIVTVVGAIMATSPLEAKQLILDQVSERLDDLPGIREIIVSQPRGEGNKNPKVASRSGKGTRDKSPPPPAEPKKPRKTMREIAEERVDPRLYWGFNQEQVKAAYFANRDKLTKEEDIAVNYSYGIAVKHMTAGKISRAMGKSTGYWKQKRLSGLVKLNLIKPGGKGRELHTGEYSKSQAQ